MFAVGFAANLQHSYICITSNVLMSYFQNKNLQLLGHEDGVMIEYWFTTVRDALFTRGISASDEQVSKLVELLRSAAPRASKNAIEDLIQGGKDGSNTKKGK